MGIGEADSPLNKQMTKVWKKVNGIGHQENTNPSHNEFHCHWNGAMKTTWSTIGKQREIWIFKHSWKGNEMVQPLWKTVTQFPQLHRLPCDPAISLLGIHPRERKTCVFTETCRVFIGSSLHYSQLWRALGHFERNVAGIWHWARQEISSGRNLVLG